MKKRAISVIVPVYNSIKYLSECLDSILSQTFNDFELILVDDGSSDGSEKLCDEYTQKYPETIITIHQKNGGISSARNSGIDLAKGDFIAFVDSDDVLDNEYLEILHDNIQDKCCDLSICDYDFFYSGDYPDNEHFSEHSFPITGNNLSPEELWNVIHKKGGVRYVVVWNKLYRRSIWEELRFPIGRINEDEFVLSKVFFSCRRISCTDRVLYHYRQHNESIMGQFRFLLSIKNFDALDAMRETVTNLDNIGKYNMNRSSVKRYAYVLANVRDIMILQNITEPSCISAWNKSKRDYERCLGMVIRTKSLKTLILFVFARVFPRWYIKRMS